MRVYFCQNPLNTIRLGTDLNSVRIVLQDKPQG